jgi:branched-chain amino acid transport system permease protein
MNLFPIFRKNIILLIILSVLAGLFIAAAVGMETSDFVITLLRGLSVGSLTFLVASGFSLIFGLLDVLNLAHGTLFMIGAYIGWTVFVRPDTFVDLLTPVILILSGFMLKDLWTLLSARVPAAAGMKRYLPWAGLPIAALILISVMRNYPIAIWDVGDYAQSPVSISYLASQGQTINPQPATFEAISPALAFIGLVAGSLLLAFSLSLFEAGKQVAVPRLGWRSFIGFVIFLLAAILFFVFNNALTTFLAGLNSNWLFLVAVLVAVGCGAGLGALMETTLIRPLVHPPDLPADAHAGTERHRHRDGARRVGPP